MTFRPVPPFSDMNKRSIITISNLFYVLSLGSTSSVMAGSLYWDINDLSGLAAGDGIWSTSVANWNSSATPVENGRVVWTNPSDAFFNASGTSIVTVSGTVEVSSMTFNGAGYTIAGSSLTLTGAGGNISVNADAAISAVIAGSVGLTKLGSSTLTLSGVNTYTGTTTVSGGKLTVSSSGLVNFTVGVTIGAGEFIYNSDTALSQPVTFNLTGGSLSGIGTITPGVTLSSGNTYSAGAVGDPGTQAFTGGLTLASGSIFSWDLDATTTDPGANTANSGSYDIVTGNGTGTGTFEVVLGSNSFTDVFWNSNKTWNNIFSGSNPTFSTFAGTDVASSGLVTGEGQFTYTGSSLTWTAVPEPTSALAGILLGAGMLRRKRVAA